MLQKTQGIVLKTTKYAETSLVADIYTQMFGLQTYLINGVYKPRSRFPKALLQILSVLELEVYHRPTEGLNRLKELKIHCIVHDLYTHPHKQAATMFVAELLQQTLHTEEQDDTLFDFLVSSILFFEHTPYSVFNVLAFVIELSTFLGFQLYANYHPQTHTLFNLNDARFDASLSSNRLYAAKDASRLIGLLLQNQPFEHKNVPRQTIIHTFETMFRYYKLHLPTFGTIKSFDFLMDTTA